MRGVPVLLSVPRRDELPSQQPWLHFADSLPFPVEISSRMRLIPQAKASKDVGRRLSHARDMGITMVNFTGV